MGINSTTVVIRKPIISHKSSRPAFQWGRVMCKRRALALSLAASKADAVRKSRHRHGQQGVAVRNTKDTWKHQRLALLALRPHQCTLLRHL